MKLPQQVPDEAWYVIAFGIMIFLMMAGFALAAWAGADL